MAYLTDNVDALYTDLDSYFRDYGLFVFHGEVKTGQTRVDISDISDIQELMSFATSHNDGFIVFGDFVATMSDTLDPEASIRDDLSLDDVLDVHVWKFSMSFVHGGIHYRFMATCEEFLDFLIEMDQKFDDEKLGEDVEGREAVARYVRHKSSVC